MRDHPTYGELQAAEELCDARVERLKRRLGWHPIDTAQPDPTAAVELGLWNGARWVWLTHGTWDGTHKCWMDDEKINPTHWREIGRPETAETGDPETCAVAAAHEARRAGRP